MQDFLHLEGFIPREGVQSLIENSDVVLHTSELETFSLVAAEALTSARPLVIQPDGGHRDFAAGPFAQFPSDRSPEAFADAVEQAISLNQPRELEENARALAERLSEEAFRERWNAVYQEVLR